EQGPGEVGRRQMGGGPRQMQHPIAMRVGPGAYGGRPDRIVQRDPERDVGQRRQRARDAVVRAEHDGRHLARERGGGAVELVRGRHQHAALEVGRAGDATGGNPLYRERGGDPEALPVVAAEQVDHDVTLRCSHDGRAPGASGSGRPQVHTQPRTRAGFPTTSACAGTSAVTTAPMPTMAYAPIVRPGPMTAPAPMVAPSPTRPGSVSSPGAESARPPARSSNARGYRSLVKITPAAIMTRSAMVIPVGM